MIEIAGMHISLLKLRKKLLEVFREEFLKHLKVTQKLGLT